MTDRLVDFDPNDTGTPWPLAPSCDACAMPGAVLLRCIRCHGSDHYSNQDRDQCRHCDGPLDQTELSHD